MAHEPARNSAQAAAGRFFCKPAAGSAPALIAAKPVKPCDRDVLGALNGLQKTSAKRCAVACCLAWRFYTRPWPDGKRVPVAHSALGRKLRLAATRALLAAPDFATDSIAAKSLKPCDGGVFRGSEFALKKRVNTHQTEGAPGMALGLFASDGGRVSKKGLCSAIRTPKTAFFRS